MGNIIIGSMIYDRVMEQTVSGAVVPMVVVESSLGDYIGFYENPQKYAYNADGSILTTLTQEEVDDIIAQYQANNTTRIGDGISFDYQTHKYQMDFGDYELDVQPNITKGCKHQWKNYVGLNHKFTYCTLCDEKK